LQCLSINNTYYEPEIVKATDYFPFGKEITERSWISEGYDYRYGFNGKGRDDTCEWNDLAHYDYGFRIYNLSVFCVKPMQFLD